MRLFPDLNEADNWHEHSQVPEPPGQDVRSFFPQQERNYSSRGEKRDRQEDFPYWQAVVRMGIENGQPHWPEHLPNVGDIGDQGIVDSRQDRQLLRPTECMPLGKKCNDAGDRGESEQRDFFQDQLSRDRLSIQPGSAFAFRFRRGGFLKSAQRPVIQKQKHKGESH